jgi:hypothetical protein
MWPRTVLRNQGRLDCINISLQTPGKVHYSLQKPLRTPLRRPLSTPSSSIKTTSSIDIQHAIHHTCSRPNRQRCCTSPEYAHSYGHFTVRGRTNNIQVLAPAVDSQTSAHSLEKEVVKALVACQTSLVYVYVSSSSSLRD